MKRTRVLLLHPFDAFSGAQRVAATLARAMTESNLIVDFRLGFGTRGFVSSTPGVRTLLGVNHIASRKLLYPFWLVAMWPRMILAALRGEVVWANTVNAVAAALPMLLLAPHRLVIHAHEVEFARLTRRLVRWAGERGAQILGVSHLHVERLRVPADVLPNCVEIASDAPADSVPTIIFAGMPSALKGFPLFIEVVRRLPKKGLRCIAYVPSRSPPAASLLQDAEDVGIEFVVGRVNPLDIYPGATLLLQCTDPSLWTETFSLVMVEAIACSVPVATAGVAVAAEVLGDAWAFDVNNRDPARIAAEIERLLSSPERLGTLRAAAVRQREKFTYERFRANVQALVERAVAARSRNDVMR
jgi:glycosyltransferase involved in cell wall biosynthesis